MTVELREYQKKAANFLVKLRRAVLGSEVRTGKTAIVIRAAEKILEERAKSEGWEGIVVVCPSNVKQTFAAQIRKFGKPGTSIQVIDIGKQEIDASTWVIMSYHIALKKFPRYQEIGLTPPVTIIFDEAHRLKNLKAKTTQALLGKDSWTRKASYVWLLTGTPFPNNLIDCYSLFNFCLYGKLGKYWDFVEKYCYSKTAYFGGRKQRIVFGCKKENLPELVELVKPILHRDTIEDIRPELPDAQHIEISLEHTMQSGHICEKLALQCEAAEAAISAGGFVKNPELMSLRRQLAVEKIKPAIEFIRDKLEDVRPIVVCAKHLELIHGLHEGLKKNLKTEVIAGSTPQKKRDEIREAFQAGEIDCLILSIEAGGEGVDLSASNMMIIVEEEWTPKAMDQVRGRILSLTKMDVLTYYYLLFPEFKTGDGRTIQSIDERVHSSLQAKRASINKFWKILDGKPEKIQPIKWSY